VREHILSTAYHSIERDTGVPASGTEFFVEARDSAVHFEAGALVDGLARIADKPGRRQSHLYASFD